MTQEFVTLPREVAERALKSMLDARCSVYDGFEYDKAATALAAAMEQTPALDQPQNHVPDAGNMVTAGWRLVPVEPTEKMVDMGRGLSSFPNGVYRAMLSAAPQPPTTEDSSVVQPQANQPAMTPIAQRKLDSLLTEGYTISGYSVYHEQKHQHGFVTGAGLAGWWRPNGMEYPQPKGEQEPVAEIQVKNGHWIDTPVARTAHLVDGVYKLYTHPQPKREPLTDEQIDAIADAMPGGLEGFMKGWGWRQFARAVLEAAPQPPTTEQSSAVVEECLTDELKPRFSAHDDAERLKSVARGMSYNDHGEAIWKHTLMEIAVRLESGGYSAPQPPALEQQVEKESTCKDYLQVEQEPVAWMKTWDSVGHARTGMKRVDLTPECETWLANMFPVITPLYAHPQPKREPLENEQSRRIYDSATYAASLAVFMTRVDAEHPDADDKGVSGWLQEAEYRVKRRITEAAHNIK